MNFEIAGESKVNMKAVEAVNIRKVFKGSKKGNGVVAIDDLSIDVEKREFVSIVGPSGCGKSTFLLMVAGLETLTEGTLLINGKKAGKPEADRAIVFQEYLLFPWRTVKANIEFGPALKKVSKKRLKEISSYYIDLVGLKGFENSYPHELSGGMQQRVGIARALANEPEILLMDEPFGALDALTRETLQLELLKIWQKTTCTVLFVTHSISEAIYLSDKVVVMSSSPGRVKAVLPVNLERPRRKEMFFSDEFREYENILKEIVWEEVLETA